MQSLGFESKNQTIYEIIDSLDKVRLSSGFAHGSRAEGLTPRGSRLRGRTTGQGALSSARLGSARLGSASREGLTPVRAQSGDIDFEESVARRTATARSRD